jgi:hypothetical protein
MKIKITISVLAVSLMACASVRPTAVDTLPLTFTPTETSIYPTPSLIPTQPSIVVLTPNTAQLERWTEYQMELAKLVLSQAGDIYPYYESALCEWDILGNSGQEVVYLWALCSTPDSSAQKPALLHLNLDGSIQDVKVVFSGYSWDSDVQKLFPGNVVEKIHLYSSAPLFSGRPFEMQQHIQYREKHPEVPPLIVLSVTPTP